METNTKPTLKQTLILAQQLRQEGWHETAPGITIHYEYYEHPAPVGIIVLLHGYTEAARKYAELAYRLWMAGFTVYVPEHRGHGFSTREVEGFETTHIERFDDYVCDLRSFLTCVVHPSQSGAQVMLYGHSMGGGIVARYLQDYPHEIGKAVLSSPMAQPCTAGFSCLTSFLLCDFFLVRGKGRDGLFLSHGYNAEETFERCNATGEERFQTWLTIRNSEEHYQNWTPSYAWVRNALCLKRKLLKRKNCRKIDASVLIFSAGKDTMVKQKPLHLLAERIPGATLVEVPGAKHEIFMSQDEIVDTYIRRIISFYHPAKGEKNHG